MAWQGVDGNSEHSSNEMPPAPLDDAVRACPYRREREFCITNLLVRIHFIIVTVRRTGLAPWEFTLQMTSAVCRLASSYADPT